ncbi:unnamed protein product [Nyctereutes procyonoides]|uniref:(raccoon dog) hypothetical protein n=1 Tax=Nyctereutes procyonoides TaxID=34880 RepID=A0A811XW89_NYCPR|nr:unnamed protein product [Nyctereutes procyonoides]
MRSLEPMMVWRRAMDAAGTWPRWVHRLGPPLKTPAGTYIRHRTVVKLSKLHAGLRPQQQLGPAAQSRRGPPSFPPSRQEDLQEPTAPAPGINEQPEGLASKPPLFCRARGTGVPVRDPPAADKFQWVRQDNGVHVCLCPGLQGLKRRLGPRASVCLWQRGLGAGQRTPPPPTWSSSPGLGIWSLLSISTCRAGWTHRMASGRPW